MLKPLTVWIIINWKILKEMGIPGQLTCILTNVYLSQVATVRTGYGTVDWFQIEKGICQEFILSTCLFNLYVEFSSDQLLSCVWLCDPMKCSTPGLPVHHQLQEFTQTHVHRVSDAIQPSHPLSSPWGYWYFSRQSWFQLVFLPVQHFSWCTLHVS